jgi:pimeloyl-ACP methyl ester carboxylesterase
MSSDYRSLFITMYDGLRLHVRVYGPGASNRLPVVCLPGLARTSADFHELALSFAGDRKRPRQVFAVDYRGRGRSDYDRDPANYSLSVELNDALAMLAALDIGPAVFIGTSRGGILTMLLATSRPAVIAGAVLNDIGPVIEPRGLVRIKSYLGKLPQPASFEEAGEVMRRLFSGHFPNLTSSDWIAFGRRTYEEQNGTLTPCYDPKLVKALEGIDLERPLLPMWDQFDALARVPVMVIRGANSDLLSSDTVVAMRRHRPDLEVVEVPDQGHAPLLSDAGTILRIGAFIPRCEPITASMS